MYRLDRLTSGLVILGKNFKATLAIDKHIKERTAQKCYVSRVVGEFPTGRIVVDKPLDCASFKVGMFWVNETSGKESKTEFERLSYNGKTSVVLCYPKTGRTHQIRIHLQYLGHPIVNDPLYNSPAVWGPTNGKGGVYEFTKEQLEANFLKQHSYEAFIVQQEQLEAGAENEPEIKGDEEAKSENVAKSVEATSDTTVHKEDSGNGEQFKDETSKRKIDESEIAGVAVENDLAKKLKTDDENASEVQKEASERNGDMPTFDKSKLTFDEECFECKVHFKEPTRQELIMYLHALSYTFGERSFKTEMPEWAKEDFVDTI